MSERPDSNFPSTRWSLVERVRASGGESGPALQELCRLYWRPVYLYARKAGHSQQDAEDLTQSFFAALIEKDTIASAVEERGRLRTFLLTAFQRFSVSAWRRENRSKRAGGIRFTGIDEIETILTSTDAPDAVYDRAWATGIVAETEAALECDYNRRGRGELFRRLRPLLSWNSAPDGTADAIALACSLTPSAVRVALKRLREAWRREIERAVTATVVKAEDVPGEVRWLLTVWARHSEKADDAEGFGA